MTDVNRVFSSKSGAACGGRGARGELSLGEERWRPSGSGSLAWQ